MRGGRGAWEKMADFARPPAAFGAAGCQASTRPPYRFLWVEDAGCAALAPALLSDVPLMVAPAWTVTACSWPGAGRASLHVAVCRARVAELAR